MNDPYVVLGISRNADKKQIKEAYNRLVKKYHPDVNPDSGSEERLKEINIAYSTIKNNSAKTEYFDFFSKTNYYKQENYSYECHLTLEEIFDGTTVKFKHKEKELAVFIPAGTLSGRLFRLTVDNDIISVTVYVRKHHYFNVNHFDLISVLEIGIIDVLLGTTVELLTIDNQKLNIAIPENVLDEEPIHVGQYGMKTDSGRGHYYVIIKHIFPKLTDSQKEILKKVKE